MAKEKSDGAIRAAGQISQVKNKLRGGKPFKIIELSIPIRSGGLSPESRLLLKLILKPGKRSISRSLKVKKNWTYKTSNPAVGLMKTLIFV